MEYKEGLIDSIYFAYRLYTNIFEVIQIIPHSRRKFYLLFCELFNEHLSVFLDMVNIKHNIELWTALYVV